MKNRILTISLIGLTFLASCRPDAPEINNPSYDVGLETFEAVFDSFWHGMNTNYAFWSVDPTDWDAVYDEYMPKFISLDEDEVLTVEECRDKAIELYEELTSTLVDGHFGLTFSFDETRTIMPGFTRIQSRKNYISIEDFHDMWKIANENMVNSGRLCDYDAPIVYDSEGNPITRVVGTGILDNDIIYLKVFMFHIGDYSYDENVTKTMDRYYDYIDNYPDVAGIIIDLRNNQGGLADDLRLVMGKLVKPDSDPICYLRAKNGPGRRDYGPWIPQTVNTLDRKRELDVPIVALANMTSVSMAEITTMAIQSMSNGVFIGEQTFGAHGPYIPDPNFFYLFNGGYFKNSIMCKQ